MAAGEVRIEAIGDVRVFRADRPPVNAIDLPFVRTLEAAFRGLAADPATGAVVVTGRPGSFCAGLDLKAVPAYGPAQQREMVTTIDRLVAAVYGAPFPVVAAVNGHAIAGGLCLALAADYRIAARGAFQLGLTEVRAGVPFPFAPLAVVKAELAAPVARVTALLARNCGPEDALARGLVDELEAPERLLDRAVDLARDLAALPRDAYVRTKHALRRETLDAIRAVVESGTDPMLESWIGPETPDAAARVLAGRHD